MRTSTIRCALTAAVIVTATAVLAQAPKPERLSGTIEAVDGHTVTAK
jgi:hypothetical protein